MQMYNSIILLEAALLRKVTKSTIPEEGSLGLE